MSDLQIEKLVQAIYLMKKIIRYDMDDRYDRAIITARLPSWKENDTVSQVLVDEENYQVYYRNNQG